jgi:hypothetical protein
MVYAYQQDVPIGEDVYRKIMVKLGPEPLAGLLTHVVVRREDGNLRYIDVWESEAACARAFEDRIHPAVFAVFQEIGFRPQGEPTKSNIDVIDVTFGHAAAQRSAPSR